ncbi:hypothetical protein ACF0H5_017554 [Mactra antiquata]
MPLCFINTNLKRSELADDIEERLAKTISDMLDVPLEWVFAVARCELPAYLAGSREPGILCQVHAKKLFNNEELAKKCFPILFPLLKETTKVPGNRIVIELVPVQETYADIGS